jgi:hypothetical protein
MASPPSPSVGTTCARTIVTLDGYVSRGRSPAPSVPRDHAMLQDFAKYLELRLQCQNMEMLRRIFADFLNENENTLVPMLRLGFTIITIDPVLQTRARRLEQAAALLAKPKSYLDERGCVFFYLQYRAATRNMALFKHMFLEFVNKRETALLEFVARGCQVISVIPFELPQRAPPMRPPQPPQQPQQQEAADSATRKQQESPRAVEAAVERQQGAAGGRLKRKKKRKGSPTVVDKAAAEGAEPQPPKRQRGRPRGAVRAEKSAAASGEPAVATRRSERIADGAASASAEAKSVSPPASSPAAVSTPRHGRKPKTNVPEAAAADDPPVEAASADAEGQDECVPPASTSRRSGRPKANAAKAAASPAAAADPPRKQAKKAKASTADPIREKSHKRGKPVMSEEMCRQQLELRSKMQKFEEQIPWEAVYGNLPAPFDEAKHPELSRKFRKFWRKHARAVWERHFWSPMSRKLSLQTFNKRNNRQLVAKNAFESLIVSVYNELGAQFFVDLDARQPPHPGWWYRGSVVALFALQQIKGEAAVWEYVNTEALERFPDCKLPVPLKSPNCGALRKLHSQESKSMWMANHALAPKMLHEIAGLKAGEGGKEQQIESPQAAAEPDGEPGSGMTLEEALGLM